MGVPKALSATALDLFYQFTCGLIQAEVLHSVEDVARNGPNQTSAEDIYRGLRELHCGEFLMVTYSLESIMVARGRKYEELERNMTKVFIVHGHDDELLAQVDAFLRRIDLEPVIIAEQPSGGMTIIEMIEAHSDVQFAVILLTPDDKGGMNAPRAKLQPRARQNVILELGYFCGRLGRNRVQALYKGDLEIPSDYHGVVYNKVDAPNRDWRNKIAQDLKKACVPFNEDRILG